MPPGPDRRRRVTCRDPTDGTTGRVRRDIAEAVLALRPQMAPTLPTVASIGATRRLRALARLGWSTRQLAHETGLGTRAVIELLHGERERCLPATHAKTVAAFERLWNTPAPQDTPRQRASHTQAVRRATTEGWPLPMELDDDTVDLTDAEIGSRFGHRAA